MYAGMGSEMTELNYITLVSSNDPVSVMLLAIRQLKKMEKSHW